MAIRFEDAGGFGAPIVPPAIDVEDPPMVHRAAEVRAQFRRLDAPHRPARGRLIVVSGASLVALVVAASAGVGLLSSRRSEAPPALSAGRAPSLPAPSATAAASVPEVTGGAVPSAAPTLVAPPAVTPQYALPAALPNRVDRLLQSAVPEVNMVSAARVALRQLPVASTTGTAGSPSTVVLADGARSAVSYGQTPAVSAQSSGASTPSSTTGTASTGVSAPGPQPAAPGPQRPFDPTNPNDQPDG